MIKPTKNSVHVLAILSCLVAASLWGLLWYPMRRLESMGLTGIAASLLVYTAALIPLLPFCLKNYRRMARRPLFYLLLALAAGWANLGFILAILEGTVVRVILLFYLSPVWTVILGWFILHEKPGWLAWVTIIMAMIGAVIMLWQPGTSLPLPGTPADIMAITAGMAFALMNIIIRKAGDIPVRQKMIPVITGVILLCLVAMAVLQLPLPTLTFPALGLGLAVGAAGLVMMIFTAQYGVTHLPVHRSAILFLFEIVAGAVSAALLTDEMVTSREWLGGALVIIAACLSARDSLQLDTGLSKNTVT
ncbi:MAG TPA: DMT family transporter [Gammaproteobacteria bacterium]|nr:DMT family transporter [Gammaproteobacteria bacterium]